MSARIRTDVGSRPTDRQILRKYCYVNMYVAERHLIGETRVAGHHPHVSPGCNSLKTPQGETRRIFSLSRDVVVRDDEGMLPAVVGYLYVTNERPCEIASLHDVASPSEFIVRVRIIYVRQKNTHTHRI